MTGALAIAGAYALIWVYTSRWLYGRWHCSRPARKVVGRYVVVVDPSPPAGAVIERFADPDLRWSIGVLTFASMVLSLAWPMVWLTALVRFRPPPTAAERAAAEAELKARITELEREAGIRP